MFICHPMVKMHKKETSSILCNNHRIKEASFMSLPIIVFTVSFLSILGIIFLTEFLMHILYRSKNTHHQLIIHIPHPASDTENIVKSTVKKYPSSKIIIHIHADSYETKKMLEILQREYPNILINFI